MYYITLHISCLISNSYYIRYIQNITRNTQHTCFSRLLFYRLRCVFKERFRGRHVCVYRYDRYRCGCRNINGWDDSAFCHHTEKFIFMVSLYSCDLNGKITTVQQCRKNAQIYWYYSESRIYKALRGCITVKCCVLNNQYHF